MPVRFVLAAATLAAGATAYAQTNYPNKAMWGPLVKKLNIALE